LLFRALAMTVIVAGIAAVFRRAYSNHGHRESIRIVVPSGWVLGALPRASGAILRSGPRPERIALDLTDVAHISGSQMASLDAACSRWAAAGVLVTIEGCDAKTALAIGQHGVRAEVLARRTEPPEC
jgi:hypothetical protein